MSNSIKIGSKMEKLASVNITYNTISAGNSVGVYPSSEDKLSLSHLILKPLSHFRFKSPTESNAGNYELNINVLADTHHLPDENNFVECKTVGKNILVFLNFSQIGDAIKSTNYLNYRFSIEFNESYNSFIKGKEIIIVTASGDPEEGDASKVIVEDEDEI